MKAEQSYKEKKYASLREGASGIVPGDGPVRYRMVREQQSSSYLNFTLPQF